MKFKLSDGSIVSGRSYRQVVANMGHLKLVEPASVDGYRRATARRASEQHAVIIDATSDRSFVKSLEAAGLAERIS